MFLTHLAMSDKVLASIRNPAKSALRFLYRQAIKIYEPWLTDVAAMRQGKRLPGVQTVAAVRATLARIPRRIGVRLDISRLSQKREGHAPG